MEQREKEIFTIDTMILRGYLFFFLLAVWFEFTVPPEAMMEGGGQRKKSSARPICSL